MTDLRKTAGRGNEAAEIARLRQQLATAEEVLQSLRIWRDEAVAACAKRGCSLRDRELKELRERLRTYEADRICLNCGRTEPCMTEADLDLNVPAGVPCTFDPTPRELFEENKRLRALIAQHEDTIHRLSEPAGTAKDTPYNTPGRCGRFTKPTKS